MCLRIPATPFPYLRKRGQCSFHPGLYSEMQKNLDKSLGSSTELIIPLCQGCQPTPY